MRGRGILHKIVSLVIFILLEIAMLHLVSANADLQRIWIARGSHAFMGTVWGASESVRHYFTLSAENKKLALNLLQGKAVEDSQFNIGSLFSGGIAGSVSDFFENLVKGINE